MSKSAFVLLPVPEKCIRQTGSANLPSSASIEEGLPESIQRLARTLCKKGPGPQLSLRTKEFSAASPEAYQLRITAEEILIEGASPAGVWHGLQTLRQLTMQGNILPCLEIEDAPAIANRGFMLDISRNKVPKMDSLYSLVDLLSLLKINQFQLYTEHTFAFEEHGLVWGDASPMIAADIQNLDAYCRERFIELVPNFNSFGHVERWLRYPEYFHLAESPYGWNAGDYMMKDSGTVLKPNDASLDFVDTLWKELLPNFSSRKFNIGCDETWELGLGWSRPMAKEKGKQSVYLDFLVKLAERARKQDRQTLFWADILLHQPESIDRLPKDMVPVIWGYAADHPFDEQCPLVAASGLQYYVAPGTSTWNTLTGDLDNAFENLSNAARNAVQHGAEGLLITNWGDNGHHQTWPLTLPGLVYGAAVAWSYETNKDVDLVSALSQLVFEDHSHKLAEALLRLGQLNRFDAGGKLNPANRLFQIFFTDNTNLSWLIKDMDRPFLTSLIEELHTISETLTEALPTAPDGPLLCQELELNIQMARLACKRGKAWLDLIENDDVHSLQALRGPLQQSIGRFESIWICRNRVGGLHDSSARMRKILDQIGEPARNINYRYRGRI